MAYRLRGRVRVRTRPAHPSARPSADQDTLFSLGPEPEPSPAPAQPAPSAPPPARPAPAAPAPAAPAAAGQAAPVTPAAQAAGNVAAITALRELGGRRVTPSDPVTPAQAKALGRFTGWGASPQVFDPAATGWAKQARAALSYLLDEDELRAARRSVLNAHYTDPAVAAAMWDTARALGFTAGDVLEPGCGNGRAFLRHAGPAEMVTGVELDPVAAAIAAALHPTEIVKPVSFGSLKWARDWFDLVIGNVPFGDYPMTGADPVCPDANWPIHNHFLIKALRLLRPGGIMLALTSRLTLDSAGDDARKIIGGLGDLLGAVRLPESSHQAAAGTKVVMDLLVLRRRPAGTPPAGLPFTHAVPMDLGGHRLEVNQVFGPAGGGHTLGDLTAGTSAHGPVPTVILPAGQTVTGLLAVALEEITERALLAGLGFVRRAGPRTEGPDTSRAGGEEEERDEGDIRARLGGRFTQLDGGRDLPLVVPATQAAELAQLLGLKDTLRALLSAEAADTTDAGDTPRLAGLRADLNTRYDTYRARFGCLNRYTARRKVIDPGEAPSGVSWYSAEPVTGPGGAPSVAFASMTGVGGGTPPLVKVTITRPRQGGFRADPFSHVVYALEDFDGETQTAAKAPIFHGRVIIARNPATTAANPADALALSMDVAGRVDLGYIAGLMGLPGEAEARAALGALAYPDPEQDGQLVPAAEYLSGNVRARLAAAEAAAADDDAYQPGVDALRMVQPRDLGPAQIRAQLGAAWIPADVVRDFLRELLEDPGLRVDHPGGAFWTVEPGKRKTVRAMSAWGTDRYPAYDLAESLLEQRPITVYDNVQVSPKVVHRIFNPEATLAALDKARELGEEFAEWVWADPARAVPLCATYNAQFNNLVLRTYDAGPCECAGPDPDCGTCAGKGRVPVKLTLPGLAAGFDPHPHQYEGVARMKAEPSALLAHVVGGGKTATMAIGVMEMRRLGLIGTACIVVPNHMLHQFGREWMHLYPLARVLVTGKDDLTEAGRRRLHARVATGRWDAVIMSRTGFERIPMPVNVQEAYWQREVDYLTGLIDASSGLTVKKLEGIRARLEHRIAKKLDAVKDPSLTFDMLGITYLVVDELHGYKNLLTVSVIPDAAIDGSKRSTDLHMKLEWLRARYHRVVTGATATPIANSITEAFVMIRLLRPDLLDDAGCREFDAWAATFGRVVARVELAPEGGSAFRVTSRFREFHNVPELKRMFHVFADVKLAAQLGLKVPLIAARADGRREAETVVTPRSDGQGMFVSDLGQRATGVRKKDPRFLLSQQVNPETGRRVVKADNMLWISTHGRMASLDLRLVADYADDDIKAAMRAEQDADIPGKIAFCAARIAAVNEACPGRLQIVFCDMGTPGRPDRWNAYDDLAFRLEAAGFPRGRVRFIHDAKDDRAKARLFAACNAGQVSVIVGSTEMMGTGVNIQRLAVAVHHLDAPWRPADIEQRDGRAIRQRNLCPEVYVFRYVTEGSFDAFMWQALARKAFFIGQFMSPDTDTREIAELGDITMSYTQVQAVATGNPLLLEAAEAKEAARTLTRAARQHERTQDDLARLITRHAESITRAEEKILGLDAVLARRQDVSGDHFRMDVDGMPYTVRADAGTRLKAVLGEARDGLIAEMEAVWQSRKIPPTVAGSLAGFDVMYEMNGWRFQPEKGGQVSYGAVTAVSLAGVPGSAFTVQDHDLDDVNAAGLPGRLERRALRLEEMIGQEQAWISSLRQETDHAREQLGQPFTRRPEMEAAVARSEALEARMLDMARTSDRRHHDEAVAGAGSAKDPGPAEAAA